MNAHVSYLLCSVPVLAYVLLKWAFIHNFKKAFIYIKKKKITETVALKNRQEPLFFIIRVKA